MSVPPAATPAPRPWHAIIGLSTSELRDPLRVYHDPRGEPPQQELALGLTYPRAIRAAEARALPVLAICRGLQVLNVSRGGTLIQDLPSLQPSDVQHRQDQVGSVPTHDVRVEPDSLVAACLGASELRVNSFHHQAVGRLGSGLRVVATSPDGVVEAIESVDRPFTIAVQWHAESMVRSPEQARMVAAFAQEAARRTRAGVVRAAATREGSV